MTKQSKSDQLRAFREARSARSGTVKGKPQKAAGPKTADGGARHQSDGGVEGHAGARNSDSDVPVASDASPSHPATIAASVRPAAGIKAGPSDKPKRGRPRLGEKRKRHEPWKALGLTERTYYRRLKAERERSTKK